MSGDGQQQLQKAIFDALTTALAAAGPLGAAVPIYDHVPQKSGFPYVVIGESEIGEFDTTTEIGQLHHLQIHTYVRNDSLGKKPVQQLQKLIYDALHDASLALGAGAALVWILQDFSTTFTEPDNVTQHGVQGFTAATTEA